MNIYSLIRLHHVKMLLTSFKRIVSSRTNVNAKSENGKMSFYLARENNHDEVISMLCIVLTFFFSFFFCFIDHKLYEFLWSFVIMQILCENYRHKE
jgi:hypothetical protein